MLYTGTPENDTFTGGSDNDTANGNGGNDTLTGGVGDDVITGDDGNDSLAGDWGNDTVFGGAGLDTLEGGFGDDSLSDGDGGSVMNGGDGFDSLTGGSGADVLNGGTENDWLSGGGAADILTDGEIGNAEADTLLGGTGDDVLISRGGADSIDGGAGIDSLVLDRTAYAGVLVVAVAQMATAEGALLADGTRISGVDLVEIRSGSGNDSLLGAAAADRLRGGSGNDSVSGGSGNDRLDGEDGDDLLLGGGGNDTLNGGNGTDTVSYANAGGAVTVNLAVATAQNTGGGGTDMLSGIENAIGSAFTDILAGSAAGNRLDGGAGADTLLGGAGNDSYFVDHAGDAMQEGAGNGVDIVYAGLSWTLAGNVENLVLSGGDINGTGNGLNNALTGTAGNNVLDGKTGSDIMAGGLGDDTYYVDHIQDNVAEQHLQGTDTVISSVSYSLFGRAVEIMTLTGSAVGATGNGLNNTLTGTDGNNVLDGAGGADKLVGGLGDDTYYVDHIQDDVTEQHWQGNDLVYSTITYSLFGRAVEALILTGAAHISGTGNSLANTLTGNSGNNALDGSTGADSMAGGAGDDSYIVDSLSDAVVEQAGEGRDRVTTGLSYTLGANVEDLVLTGGALTATGNGLDNALNGTDAANTLNGLGGNDTLTGGKGNDTYYVDSAGDTIVEAVGDGTDVVFASASYVLADTARAETLTLTGSENLNATGNIAANTVNGNSGNNVLDGNGGVDTMSGGLGDDTYYVNGLDVVIEATGGGYDSIVLQSYNSTDFALAADSEIEAVTLTGNGHIAVVGNGFNNRVNGNNGNNRFDGLAGNDELLGLGGDDSLYGGDGNDTLVGGDGGDRVNGGAGDDSMTGGLGNDTYYIDAAGDVVVELASQGEDTILVNSSYSLAGTYIEGLQLNVTTGNFSLTGNEAANRMVGNDGDNVLDGGTAADSLRGGKGNDTYTVDNAGDLLYEDADEGIDTIVSSISFEMTYFHIAFENLTLTGSAYSAKGNSRDNVLTGTSGNNYLDGSGGNDTMIGGDGNDIYVLSGADVIVEAENGGTDQVSADSSYILTGNTIENLTLQNVAAALNATGNASDNVLTGNSYANVLDGGAGADTMSGGNGNDTYIVDNSSDFALETNSSGGRDLVLASVSYTLINLVDDLNLTGSDNIDGTGNNQSNVLTGNSGVNVLNGGAGHDTYYVQTVGDQVIDISSGNDQVYSLVSFVLSEGVERLSLQGTDNISGTGNTQNNVMSGNEGNNLLDGGAGDDFVFGGGGYDTVIINSVNDEATGGGGDDTLLSSVDVELDLDIGEEFDPGKIFDFANVILTGSENLNIFAGKNNDALYGNVGNNDLFGGKGDDTLNGGAGNDFLFGGDGTSSNNGADLFLFGLGSGQDEIADFIGLEGDRIDVSAYTVGGPEPGMVSQVGSHTVIDLSNGNTITVQYTTVNEVLPYIIW